MMAVRAQPAPRLTITAPEMLFEDPGTFLVRPPRAGTGMVLVWDVARDGRFLMIKEGQVRQAVREGNAFLVQNWLDELRRLVPTN